MTEPTILRDALAAAGLADGPVDAQVIAGGDISIEVGGRYPLAEATRAHQDLQGRKTTGSIVLLP